MVIAIVAEFWKTRLKILFRKFSCEADFGEPNVGTKLTSIADFTTHLKILAGIINESGRASDSLRLLHQEQGFAYWRDTGSPSLLHIEREFTVPGFPKVYIYPICFFTLIQRTERASVSNGSENMQTSGSISMMEPLPALQTPLR